MTFESLGVVDNQILSKFESNLEKFRKTTDEDKLDEITFEICESIDELKGIIVRLDKRYIEMQEHGRKAAEMSQKRGTEARRLQNQVNELMRQIGDLKRRLKSKSKAHC